MLLISWDDSQPPGHALARERYMIVCHQASDCQSLAWWYPSARSRWEQTLMQTYCQFPSTREITRW